MPAPAPVSPPSNIIIVGAGQAAGIAAATLRSEGFAGAIVVVGDEPYPPYERPPLSKKVLIGSAEPEATYLKPEAFYAEQAIELRLGVRVAAIERAARRLTLADGVELGYDKLIVATGSKVRRLEIAGARPENVFYLRGIDDCLALRARLVEGAGLVVVGGGYIGLEVAAAARQRGVEVTVVEAEGQVMGRVVGPEIGRFFAEEHAARGVDIRTGVTVSEAAEGRARCSDGASIAADLFVVGVGVVPDTALAEAAGLAVDNGILVDEHGRTSDADIYACGDVTNHPNALLNRRVRLESWQNAQNQSIAVARALAGNPRPYGEVPWFWSDQYDLNLQMVGLPEAWERVVLRGDMAERRFTAFYLQGDRVVAANAVNNGRDIRPARELIARRLAVDDALLADPSASLRALLAS